MNFLNDCKLILRFVRVFFLGVNRVVGVFIFNFREWLSGSFLWNGCVCVWSFMFSLGCFWVYIWIWVGREGGVDWELGLVFCGYVLVFFRSLMKLFVKVGG